MSVLARIVEAVVVATIIELGRKTIENVDAERKRRCKAEQDAEAERKAKRKRKKRKAKR